MKKVIVLLLFLPALALADGLRVDEAVLSSGGHECNATVAMQQQCNGRMSCNVPVDSHLCPSMHGGRPMLHVRYRCNGNRYRMDVPWGEQASLYCNSSPVHAPAPPAHTGGHSNAPHSAGNNNVIQVIQADYGHDHRRCNARPALSARCDGDYSCSFKVGNQWCGDPARHQTKDLYIRWRCGWQELEARFAEYQWAEISCMQRVPGHERPHLPPPAPRHDASLQIHAAYYGQFPDHVCNATPAVARRCAHKSVCKVKASNHLCGDPAHGVKKTLTVEYSCGGAHQKRSAMEGHRLKLVCGH